MQPPPPPPPSWHLCTPDQAEEREDTLSDPAPATRTRPVRRRSLLDEQPLTPPYDEAPPYRRRRRRHRSKSALHLDADTRAFVARLAFSIVFTLAVVVYGAQKLACWTHDHAHGHSH